VSGCGDRLRYALTEMEGSMFCPNCGRHVALIGSKPFTLVVAVEFAPDGYTPTGQRHVCGASHE
jgi:hypothetical protein